MNLSTFTVVLKNRNFMSKINRSKVTDYAALKGRLEDMHLIVMEITLLIMENRGIVFLNFCGNPDTYTYVS